MFMRGRVQEPQEVVEKHSLRSRLRRIGVLQSRDRREPILKALAPCVLALFSLAAAEPPVFKSEPVSASLLARITQDNLASGMSCSARRSSSVDPEFPGLRKQAAAPERFW